MYRLEQEKVSDVSAFDVQKSKQAVLPELLKAVSDTADEELQQLVTSLLAANSIFVHAAGRSALSLRMAAMRMMHFGLDVHVVGDVTTPAILEGDLLVVASGSGTTASVVSIAEKAHNAGANVTALTTDRMSKLARIADHHVLIPAAGKQSSDRSASVQYAGSLFEQSLLLTLDITFHALWQSSSLTADELWRNHSNLE